LGLRSADREYGPRRGKLIGCPPRIDECFFVLIVEELGEDELVRPRERFLGGRRTRNMLGASILCEGLTLADLLEDIVKRQLSH